MWRDIGLGDWLFDMDTPGDVSRLVPTVLDMVQNPKAARARVAKAQKYVKQLQAQTMGVVKSQVAG